MNDPSVPHASGAPVPLLPLSPVEGVVEVPDAPETGVEVVTLADKVRKWGMYLLLWAFLITCGLSLVTALFFDNPDPEKLLKTSAADRDLAITLADKPFDHLKQILQILLPAETALLGSAMGFFYGSEVKSRPTS